MAYDFNSLTKQADEAINRDKFYTDFQDVDPSKLHQISELTEWLRTKGKGSDVREIIAQLFERTWLENIKEGNANMEVSLARGSYPDLRSRLDETDNKQRQTTTQLAQMVRKGDVSVNDINKNLGLLDETYMTEEFRQQMAGNTPLSVVPADKSITTNKVADKAIVPELTSFAERGKNLWDGSFIFDKRLQNDLLQWGERTGSVSVVFKGQTGKTYTISAPKEERDIFHAATFNEEPTIGAYAARSLKSGSSAWSTLTITLTGSEQYIVISLSDVGATPSWLQIEEGANATDYSSPNKAKFKIDTGSIPYNALNQSDIAVKPEQTTFVKKGKNLWNGEYIRGYRISGVAPHYMGESVGASSVIFEGETGKTYTISKGVSEYFGVALFDKYPYAGVNGVRGIRENMSGTNAPVTVTLQGNEKYIVISVAQSDNNMPEWLQIEEGANATNYVSPNAVRIDLDLPLKEIGEASTPKLHVKKTNDRMTVYVPSKHNPNKFIGHTYLHYTNNATNTWLYDSAGIYEKVSGAYLSLYMFSPGNSDNEGVLYVSGESDFIGGKHGFDYMEDISLIVDGKERDMAESFDMDCGFVKVVNKSRVNHDLTEDLPENKAFTRYKVHTWSLDGMTLEGKWIAEHDMTLTSVKLCDFSVDQKVGGIKFPVWGRNNVDYKKYSLLGDFGYTPRVSNVDTQEMWSDETEFYLALTCDYDKSKYPNHYTHIQQLDGARAKIYFDFGGYTIKAGESIEYLNKYDFRF